MSLPAGCVVVALVLYSCAIWSEWFLGRGLRRWMVAFMAIGFIADICGTSMMTAIARGHHMAITIHGVFGYAALVIMALHVAWAFLALKHHRFYQLFSQYSLMAWCLWLAAFSLGIPRF